MDESSSEKVDAYDLQDAGSVRALQAALNGYATRYRLPRVPHDGVYDSRTRALLEEIVWRLGTFVGRDIPGDEEAYALRIVAQLANQTAEQLGRERRRALNVGPPVEAGHVLRGLRLLQLIGDFDVWVHRRVETHSYAPDDPTNMSRRRSIDFTLPPEAAAELGTESDGCAVPIAFVNKWRLPGFTVRDEHDRSIPLLAREEHTALTAGMLIAMAYKAYGAGLPPDTEDLIPIEVEDDLRTIVSEERDTALNVCEQLGAKAMGADTLPEQDDAVMRWRNALVTDEAFMELAFTLAWKFLVIVLCPSPLNTRRILKMSYEWPIERPPTRRPGRWRTARQRFRSWRSGDTWLQPGGRMSPALGALHFASNCETLMVGSRPTVEGATRCVLVTIVTSEKREATFALNTQDVREIPNMPEGEYELRVRALPGFQLLSPSLLKTEIVREQTTREVVRSVQLRATPRASAATSVSTPTNSWGRRLSRALAWRSRPLLIGVSLGEGGSYHFEFEAPEGLQITRAKIVDDQRGELDIVLRSMQRAHLYVPASMCQPATGYVLLNLRPRPETVVRGATISSVIASLAVLAVGVHWQITGRAGPDGIALLVGLPGLLATYFAYSVPNSITNRMLPGVRVMGLVPGVLAFASAALVLNGDTESWALTALTVMLGAMLFVTVLLGVAWWFSSRPSEQRSTSAAQSPDFVERYLVPVHHK